MSIAFVLLAAASVAGPPANALPKVGSCPSGYSTSGDYCNPSSNARYAVVKTGSCPAGYSTSGGYCLASSDDSRHAVPKGGSCPSGYSTSGDYCLASSSEAEPVDVPALVAAAIVGTSTSIDEISIATKAIATATNMLIAVAMHAHHHGNSR